MKHSVNNSVGASTIQVMLGIIILVLVVILGLIVEPRIREAKVGKTIQLAEDSHKMVMSLSLALKLYKLDNGVYPTTIQGLNALIKKPTTGMIPKNYRQEGYFEKTEIPKDSWGNDFIYNSPGEHADFDLSSYGADGIKGGQGKNADINSWELR